MNQSDVKLQIDKTVTTNYEKFLNIAKSLSHNEYEDIVNECIMYVYEMDNEKKMKILDYLEYYIIQMIKLSATSPTSKYQQKYNKIKIDENAIAANLEGDDYTEMENFDEPEKLEFVSQQISENVEESTKKNFHKFVNKEMTFRTFINLTLKGECTWYEREVFIRYHSTENTFRDFSKETGIPLSSIFKAYKRSKKILEDKLYKKKKEMEKRNKKEIAIDINSYIKTLKGTNRTNMKNLQKMYDLYNEYYGTNERNTKCDLCAIRIYSKLKKISENYESGKRFK